MIKKIAIVPYVTNGRNSQVGHDGHFIAIFNNTAESTLTFEKK